MNTTKNKKSTLLDPAATGGEIDQTGIRFQTNISLMYLPHCLAQEGFSSLTVESMGDTEAVLFVPGQGMVIELIEAKNHQVQRKEFWSMINRFEKLDRDHPRTYAHFTLACDGVSRELKPLLNGLNRVRRPWLFYGPRSSVAEASYAKFTRIVENLGKTKRDARFLFDRVCIEANLSDANRDGALLFVRSLQEMLPEYGTVALDDLVNSYQSLESLLHANMNQPLSRKALEARLRASLKEPPPRLRPFVHLHTTAEENECNHPAALRYNWTRFFGGSERTYPTPAQWKILLCDLQATKAWIIESRRPKRIRLTGNRRLSASLALGSVFSAVAGFALELEIRGGDIWATDDHANAGTPNYRLASSVCPGKGPSLVVILSIGRAIADEVKSTLPGLGLAGMTIVQLESQDPIVSADQANLAVKRIKAQISKAMSENRCKDIHLFLAGPAFLALLLGHRLNATGPIQCYEWVSAGRYVPTCRIY